MTTSVSYRRETALQGGLVVTKSGRLELRDNIYGQYRSTLWGIKKHTKMCFAITFVKLDGF